MSESTLDPADNMIAQFRRGEFAYWSSDNEQRWKEQAPPKPGFEERTGFSQIPSSYIQVLPNQYAVADFCSNFEKMLENGKSYMVGSQKPMEEYLKGHRSPLRSWMQAAFHWCMANKFYRIEFETPGRYWQIAARGDCVEFGLPHQDQGGEKHWISKDGKTRILVNVD